jgi:glycerol uptake facilitator-like aquaporin
LKTERREGGLAPILFVALVILALIFTLISLGYYGSAKDDYAMVCEPSSGPSPHPPCTSDLNQMAFSEVLVGAGFCFTVLGLYLVRRVKTSSSQPIFYIFGMFTIILGLYALYWFL